MKTKYIEGLKSKIKELDKIVMDIEVGGGNHKVFHMASMMKDDLVFELKQAEWMEANK